jgi:apolipoprotein N-acyltransferase
VRIGGIRGRNVPTRKIACLQPCLDQLHWGNNSLTHSFDTLEQMVYTAAQSDPDAIIMAESALLCYLQRRSVYKRRFSAWVESTQTPIITGALHWEPSDNNGAQYRVFNTAFCMTPGRMRFERYYKMKLVPFSEALPFEGLFPILSRVNLGESDFSAGSDDTPFTISDSLVVAPFICYEIIYPDFVRSRVDDSIDMLLNITNDGWFGTTSGPYHHAAMARMRAIENGISLVRCANSGISLVADPAGSLIAHTRLNQPVILKAEVPITRVKTLYNRLGDWVVVIGGLSGVIALCLVAIRRRRLLLQRRIGRDIQ